jgi:hypothetical protein
MDLFPIKGLRDRFVALARDVVCEDAPDDCGLIFVDLESVAVGYPFASAVLLPAGIVGFRCVPVHGSACPESSFGLPLKTPAGVMAELLQILLAEDAHDLCANVENFEPGIHGVGSSSRNPQLVPDPPKIFTVSTEAGEVVAEENVPLRDAINQLKQVGAVVASTSRNGFVSEDQL